MGRLIAQDQATSPANTPTTANPSGSPTDTSPDASAAAADTPAALPVDQVPGATNPNDISRAQVPPMYQSPLNPQPTNIPAYAIQPGNPISPYNSTSVNPQSPQITSPTLYLTGNNDLSQISTNNALSQAFSQGGGGSDFYGDTGPDYEHAPIERLRLGPFDLKAAVVASAVGDDNLRTGGTNQNGKRSDVEFDITPAVLLAYGLHDGQKGSATLVYAPTISEFYHESAQDNIGQNVALNAVYPLQRLTFNVSQVFTQTTGVNQDSNVRTTQESIGSTVGASYEVDDKISVSSQLNNYITTYSDPAQGGQGGGNNGGQGDTTTSLANSISYRLSEKLTLGPNLNIGYDRPQGSSKSTYEQGTLGANYAPTEKIGLFAQAGAEIRQYDQGGGDTVNPIFGIGVGYTPFDSTNVTLSASQSVHTSTAQLNQPTGGQTVVSTSVGAAITQRIVQRVYVGFAFSYNHDDDSNNTGNAGGGGAGSSSQDTFTYRPTVQYNPTAWSSLALYYQYLSNESNIQGQSYNDNQIGLSVSAQF